MTLYFRIDQGRRNYLHFNLRPGPSGQSRTSLSVHNLRTAPFASGPENMVESLAASESAALVDPATSTGQLPLVQMQESGREFASGRVEISRPTVVSLMERFDEGWVLEAQALDGSESTEQLEATRHIRVNGLANGWILDPASVKSRLSPLYWHSVSEDGIILSLIAHFKPQRYLWSGLVISGSTLGMCVLFFYRALRRKHHPARGIPEQSQST
jgi:hypothetical protein